MAVVIVVVVVVVAFDLIESSLHELQLSQGVTHWAARCSVQSRSKAVKGRPYLRQVTKLQATCSLGEQMWAARVKGTALVILMNESISVVQCGVVSNISKYYIEVEPTNWVDKQLVCLIIIFISIVFTHLFTGSNLWATEITSQYLVHLVRTFKHRISQNSHAQVSFFHCTKQVKEYCQIQ